MNDPSCNAHVLDLRALRFAWPGSTQDCLKIQALTVHAAERLFLHGPSGCGKSTLLALMAGILLPQHGHVQLLGQPWQGMGAPARDRYRVDHVGYIFQQFNLLPYLSVIDNVLLPCRFSALRRKNAAQRSGCASEDAAQWLQAMQLSAALWRRPARQLSVGQQQRVAVARALIGAPALIIADEPTSALDEARRDAFLDALLAVCASAGTALVFVSHDQRIAARFSRQMSLPSINQAPALHEEGERHA